MRSSKTAGSMSKVLRGAVSGGSTAENNDHPLGASLEGRSDDVVDHVGADGDRLVPVDEEAAEVGEHTTSEKLGDLFQVKSATEDTLLHNSRLTSCAWFPVGAGATGRFSSSSSTSFVSGDMRLSESPVQ